MDELTVTRLQTQRSKRDVTPRQPLAECDGAAALSHVFFCSGIPIINGDGLEPSPVTKDHLSEHVTVLVRADSQPAALTCIKQVRDHAAAQLRDTCGTPSKWERLNPGCSIQWDRPGISMRRQTLASDVFINRNIHFY